MKFFKYSDQLCSLKNYHLTCDTANQLVHFHDNLTFCSSLYLIALLKSYSSRFLSYGKNFQRYNERNKKNRSDRNNNSNMTSEAVF